MAQWKSERDAFGLKDEFGKEQVDRLAALAKQAKQDRDVGLWMSAATGFFAMGAGKSPYALQNFAAGAGIGAEQATKALGAYSKRQSEMNQAQMDIDKARRAEKRGDFESYQNHMQRAEEKAQKSDDNYFNRMTSLVNIKQRSQEIAEQKKYNRLLDERKFVETQKKNAEEAFVKRHQLWEAAKSKDASLGLAEIQANSKDPKVAATAKAKIAEKEKEIFGSSGSMVVPPDRGAGGISRNAIDEELRRREG
jgi:hypothetical protein